MIQLYIKLTSSCLEEHFYNQVTYQQLVFNVNFHTDSRCKGSSLYWVCYSKFTKSYWFGCSNLTWAPFIHFICNWLLAKYRYCHYTCHAFLEVHCSKFLVVFENNGSLSWFNMIFLCFQSKNIGVFACCRLPSVFIFNILNKKALGFRF